MKRIKADVVIIALSSIITIALIMISTFVKMSYGLKYVLIATGIVQSIICTIVSVRIDEKREAKKKNNDKQ